MQNTLLLAIDTMDLKIIKYFLQEYEKYGLKSDDKIYKHIYDSIYYEVYKYKNYDISYIEKILKYLIKFEQITKLSREYELELIDNIYEDAWKLVCNSWGSKYPLLTWKDFGELLVKNELINDKEIFDKYLNETKCDFIRK